MKTRQILQIGCLSAMCFTACRNDYRDAELPISEMDRTYMTNMAYANIAEINTGNLAQERSIFSAVKSYGEMMVTDHTMAQQQLAEIASRKGHPLPTETDEEHKRKAAMLMSMTGRAFDSTYIYNMVEDHTKAIRLQEEEIANGRDMQVKSYASQKLNALHMHHHMADSIARTLFPR